MSSRGDLAGALQLLTQAEAIYRRLDHGKGVAAALTGQAKILMARDDMQAALTCWENVSEILRGVGNAGELKESLSYAAVILHGMGNVPGALDKLRERGRLS